MKEREMKRAFGCAPDSFKEKVASSLQEAREDTPMKRSGMRIAIVAALLVVLLLGAAYAAVSQYGLVDFFGQWEGITLPEEAGEALSFDKPLATARIGEMDIRITQAVADGRALYVAAQFTSSREGEVLLLGGGGVLQEWAELTEETQVIQTDLEVQSGDCVTYVSDFRRQPDGSIVYFAVGELKTDAESVEVTCNLSYHDMEGWYDAVPGTEQTGTITFTLPVTRAIETREMYPNQPITGMGMTVDRVVLTRTPLTTYYRLEVSFAADATEEQLALGRDGNHIDFNFMDEEGKMVWTGTSPFQSMESEDDVHFVREGSLSLTTIPDSLCFTPQVYNSNTYESKVFDPVIVQIGKP